MQITELFPSTLQIALMEYSDGALKDFMPDFYTSLPDLQEHLLYPCAGGTCQIHRPDSFAFQDVDGYLFLYTKKGQGVIHTEGDSLPLNEESLLFWDCRDYLQLRPVTSEWTVYLLFFQGDAVSVYYEEICKLRFPIFSLSEHTLIADNLRRITELGMTTSPHHAFEENRLLTDILSDLLLDLHMGQSGGKAIPPYLLKIKSLFDTAYSEEHSITELAAGAGVSRYRLSREFSEYFGQTPVRYLNSVRLSHACILLETTNQHVHEIASAVGIDSVTHFINLFKTKTGMTPATYRDSYHAFRDTGQS